VARRAVARTFFLQTSSAFDAAFNATTFFASLRRLVGVTGFEPVTLRLSSACSNQLSYTPIKPNLACRAVARSIQTRVLSTARLRYASARQPLLFAVLRAKAGGAEGIRTPDLQLAKLPLYQLSYSPTFIYDLRMVIRKSRCYQRVRSIFT
jgi:hypothetical protein